MKIIEFKNVSKHYDGQPAVRGFSLEIEAGEHKITFSKPLFVEAEMTLAVKPQDRLAPEPIRLRPAPATLTLITRPAGAALTVDALFVGKSLLTMELEPGSHTISATADGHRPGSRKISLEAAKKHDFGTRKVKYEIPMADLTEEMHRRFPGRWKWPSDTSVSPSLCCAPAWPRAPR